jgi:hypothetical protein
MKAEQLFHSPEFKTHIEKGALERKNSFAIFASKKTCLEK